MTTPHIIDGRALAERKRAELARRIAGKKTVPGLAIIQVGDNPESTLYVSLKERAAVQLGIRFEKVLLPADAPEERVRETIAGLNKRDDVHGIVVQLPLPPHLDATTVLGAVDPAKDVDGLHPAVQSAVRSGARTRWLPALPKSILALLDEAQTTFRGATAVVLAESEEFRSVMAALLKRRGASAQTAPSLDAAGDALRTADIVITALGAPHTLREADLKHGAILIDAGFTKLGGGGVAGDFAGPEEPSRLTALSPVPGGVGPMTVASLLDNTVRAWELATKRSLFALSIPPPTLLWLVPALAVAVSWAFFGGADFRGRFLLVAAIALASLLWWTVPIARIRLRWWRNPDFWFAAFLAVAAIGSALSPAPRKSVEELAVWLLAALAFFIGRATRSVDRRRFAAVVVLAALAIAAWSVWTFVAQNEVYPRVYGPFKNPDGLGAVLLLPLTLGIGLVRSTKNHTWRLLTAAATVALAAVLLLTSAVPSLVGLLLAALGGLAVFRIGRKRLLITIAVCGLIAAAASVALRSAPTIPDRFTQLTGLTGGGMAGSFWQRISFLRSSLAMTADHPVVGVGLGMWSDFFPQYQRSLAERSELAHGTVPTIFAEFGVVGGIAFLGLMVSLFAALLRTQRRAGSDDPLGAAAVIGLGAVAVAAAIDIPWFYPGILILFWLAAGIFLSPAAEPLSEKVPMASVRVGLTLVVTLLLLFGGLRFVTGYYANAADRSQAANRDFIDAIATAELAMRIFPSPTEMLRMTIILHSRSWSPPDRATVKDWAERTRRANPRQPATYLLLGRIALAEGDKTGAERILNDGLDIDPHFVPDLAVDLAVLYLADGRNTEARDLAAAQLGRTGLDVPERNRSLATIAVTKARAELALGEQEAAKASLNQALTFQPEHEEAKKLLETEFEE